MKKRLMAAAAAALALVMAVPSPVLAGEPSDDISYMGSTDATEVNVGMIMGPPSMGMGWMIHENEEGNTYNDYNFEVGGVDYTALASKLNTGDYDIIHCPSNVGAILYNNKDLKEEVEVIDISNLGLLYILTTDDSIKSMDDLKGRTVYSIGEGGPPEYTFGYLLDQEGLSDDVNFSFRSTPFEVLNLLQDEEHSIALLPQPFVEVAKLLVPDLKVPIDITEEWDNLKLESGAESVTTITIVRKKFLEEHEQAVVEYLNLLKKSVAYSLSHVDEAAEWTDTYETFLNPEVAADAIPYVNMCAITGQEMKEKLEGFLKIMYDYNPDAVGGSMPDDDFYYIPPEGSMEEVTDETTDNVKDADTTDTEASTEGSGAEDTEKKKTTQTPAEAGTYTVSANIWFKKEDSGLPMNPHITSDIFPPKDPVVDNAEMTVDKDGNATVKVPILIQDKIMSIQKIEGLDIVDSETDENGNLKSITVNVGKIKYLEDVVTKTCDITLQMGDLAMTISGFDKDQQWPATFQLNGFEETGVQTAAARGESSEINDAAVDAAKAMAFGTDDSSEAEESSSDTEN
ncbi:ABC transporter substrate-binding protein [Blautia obeum]|uniref:ABC transporter substrate-binding protein n=1 Tax=Blautia obeum TaxID=40520 RepID=UPI000E4441DB|nr:ABC transporter substrate-binding protein [Blautia obeum]RGK89304.1 ABC transporter substrate-binding protein [Blautia obeum]